MSPRNTRARASPEYAKENGHENGQQDATEMGMDKLGMGGTNWKMDTLEMGMGKLDMGGTRQERSNVITEMEKLVGVDTETLYDSMREVRTCIYILYLYVVCNEFANASSVTLSLEISKRSSMGSYTLFESSAMFSIFETRVLLV
jgi:hypothetical protein